MKKAKIILVGAGDIGKTALAKDLMDKVELISIDDKQVADFTINRLPPIETFEHLNLPKRKRGTNRMKPKKKRKK